LPKFAVNKNGKHDKSHRYSRDDQGWRFEVFDQLEAVVRLPKLGCSLSLSDIYENVEWVEKDA